MKKIMIKQDIKRGLHRLLPCMLVLLLMAGVVCAEDFVVVNTEGTDFMFRQTDGEVIWSTTTSVGGCSQLQIGPDGNVYAATSNNQDCRMWDGETGDYLGQNITDIGHRLYDICFGPDIDGDGIEDLYVFGGGDPSVKSFTSSSGYTVQGSWICTATTAWVGDFGPDVNGDGYQELYLIPDLLQNTSNILIVIDGATKAELYNFAIPQVVRPGCLEVGSDGRIYVTGRNNNTVVSYLPNGTDPQNLQNTAGIAYPTQIAEGAPGQWYVSNRNMVDDHPGKGSVTLLDDNFASFNSVLYEGAVGATGYPICMATFEGGAGRGAAHSPTPSNGSTIPSYDVLSTPDPNWLSPLQDAEGNPITDSNIVSVDKYEVWWGVGAEPNYLPGSPDSPYDNGISQTYDLAAAGEDAIDYETTYYWRVDTTVTVDNNDLQPQVLIEGSTWSFTTEPSYTPPVISTYDNVITTLDIGSGDLSATISGNSHPMGGPSFTLLTDDVEFPAGSDAAVSNTTSDNQNPTATLTTTFAGTYKVKLVVSDGTTTLEAIAEVEVYADACQAAKDAGGWSANEFDLDDNCIVDLLDYAVFAVEWLDDTSMDAQEEYAGVADYVPQAVFDARIEAEWVDPNDPNACSDGPISDTTGIRIEDQPNASGGEALGYANNTAWVEYTIDVPALAVGVAVDVYAGHALTGTGSVTLSFGTLAVPDAYGVGTLDGTSGWTNFTNGRKIGEVTFTTSGTQIVRTSYGDGLNLDWFSFDF